MSIHVRYLLFFILLALILAAGCGQVENLNKKGKLYVIPDNEVIMTGETLQYSAIANSLIGQEASADVTNLVSWESSDTDVAVINHTGLATALGTGVTDITAEFILVTNTGGVMESYSLSSTATLTVNAPDSPLAPGCGSYVIPANNWTKDSSNPLIVPGVSGSWDDALVISPSVIYNCSSYQMWYAGQDGSTGYIGYATSEDGVNWTKYASNPVLDTGTGWDSSGVSSPSVVYDGTTYHMWFSGNNGTYWKIGYATSTDGINWTKHASNPVIDFGASGEWDDFALDHPLGLYTGSGFKLWYSGTDGATYRAGYATSTDGATWTKHPSNPVLDVSTSGQWDSHHILADGVVYDGSTYYMWYSADNYSYRKTGFATSADGIVWTKDISNPVLQSTGGTWDYYHAGWSSVIFNGTGYEMFYTGGPNNNGRIGRATSD